MSGKIKVEVLLVSLGIFPGLIGAQSRPEDIESQIVELKLRISELEAKLARFQGFTHTQVWRKYEHGERAAWCVYTIVPEPHITREQSYAAMQKVMLQLPGWDSGGKPIWNGYLWHGEDLTGPKRTSGTLYLIDYERRDISIQWLTKAYNSALRDVIWNHF